MWDLQDDPEFDAFFLRWFDRGLVVFAGIVVCAAIANIVVTSWGK